MRPFLIVFLLGLVGAAMWLWLHKMTPPSVSASSPSMPEVDTLSPSTERTAGPSSVANRGEGVSEKPLSKIAAKEEKHLSDYIALELAYAEFPGCVRVRHRYYVLCYDEHHEQARWTVHILEGKRLSAGRVARTQDFRPDPYVTTGSAQLEDYRRSGYDRGHLVPAGDFKWDSVGMSETFYLSNMSPQLHEFNAGIWEEVESTVRRWAREKKRLVVYTGPVLDKNKDAIGLNRVTVPTAFYKVVYWLEDEKAPQAVAFLVPHAASRKSPVDFLVRVDSVEKITGIDFYAALPDSVEERIEGRWDRRFWQVSSARRHR
ncbi:MAG: DNA/RNA non-specific endonuclease [Bacteroidia bacterium]|nr:DNA/RNA non-specific endonuclease [Bacteroidia bacterium]